MTTVNHRPYDPTYGLAEGGINPPGSPEARAIIDRYRAKHGRKKPVTSPVAGWLDRLMTTHHVPSTALGKAIGVSDSVVRRWRCGQSVPSTDEVAALAAYFGTDVPMGGQA